MRPGTHLLVQPLHLGGTRRKIRSHRSMTHRRLPEFSHSHGMRSEARTEQRRPSGIFSEERGQIMRQSFNAHRQDLASQRQHTKRLARAEHKCNTELIVAAPQGRSSAGWGKAPLLRPRPDTLRICSRPLPPIGAVAASTRPGSSAGTAAASGPRDMRKAARRSAH